MEMLAVVCLAIVWAFLLVPPMLRRHREGRPGSSVTSFRRQLSTLERATPGTSLKPMPVYRPEPVSGARAARPMSRQDVIRRRRDVLVALAGLTGFTFLLVLVASGTLTILLFLASAAALAGYIYALVQLRRRAEEAASKVRVLRPQAAAPAPQLARRSASN